MPEGKAPTASSFSKDVLLEENIKRENKYYRISEEFTFTPKMQKNMVIAKKPTGEREQINTRKSSNDASVDTDTALSDLVTAQALAPRQKYKYPMTTSQEIGWDTVPLTNIYGSRFNHPKVKTDVTTFFLGSEKKKDGENKKK